MRLKIKTGAEFLFIKKCRSKYKSKTNKNTSKPSKHNYYQQAIISIKQLQPYGFYGLLYDKL